MLAVKSEVNDSDGGWSPFLPGAIEAGGEVVLPFGCLAVIAIKDLLL